MFKAYIYIVFLKRQKYDFPAFMLFSYTKVQMSEGTFCRVEVHINDDPGLTLTYFTAMSVCNLGYSIGKSENSGFFKNYCTPCFFSYCNHQ